MRGWRERLQGLPDSRPVLEEHVQTLEALREFWRSEHALLEAYAAGAELGGVFERRRGEVVLRAERWQAIVHLTFHNMQHRSEVAQALTLLGHSPGEIGMTQYLVERATAGPHP